MSPEEFKMKSGSLLSKAREALSKWREIYVEGDLNISNPHLTELPDLSSFRLKGSVFCNNNNLTNLKGSPRSVSGIFNCTGNPLQSLEGAPKAFRQLVSDFGSFASWDEVPKELRTSPKIEVPSAKSSPGFVL